MTDTVTPITQGDSTSAFGNNLMKVSLKNALPSGQTVTKAIIAIGSIRKTIENPTFPFYVNLTPEETAKLACGSQVYMQVFDANSQPLTCKGTVKVPTQPRKV